MKTDIFTTHPCVNSTRWSKVINILVNWGTLYNIKDSIVLNFKNVSIYVVLSPVELKTREVQSTYHVFTNDPRKKNTSLTY